MPSVTGPGGARKPRKAPIVYPTVVGQQGSNGRVQESVRESHDLQDATSMENSTSPANASTQGDSMAIPGAAPAPGDPYELSTIPGASQPSAPESMLHRVERFVQEHKPGMPHLPHLPRLPQLPHFGLGSKQPQEAAEDAVVDPDGANLDQGETRVGAESIQVSALASQADNGLTSRHSPSARRRIRCPRSSRRERPSPGFRQCVSPDRSASAEADSARYHPLKLAQVTSGCFRRKARSILRRRISTSVSHPASLRSKLCAE